MINQTVRVVVSKIDLINNEEILTDRLDFDDREMAVAATFSPSGDLIFVALQGNNVIRIVNAQNGAFIGEIPVGAAPQGLILDDERLFVQNFMDRMPSVDSHGRKPLLAEYKSIYQPDKDSLIVPSFWYQC